MANQELFGFIILFLLGMLVVVKRLASGSVLERLLGGPLGKLVNGFNLFFLLLVNPLAAIALVTRRLAAIDPTRVAITGTPLLVLEIAGLVLYVAGFILMAWALIALGRGYQLGGCPPRPEDRMVMTGPYGLIRNPMYTAALGIALGLACLLQSPAFFAVFVVYLVLILLLIPLEEKGLLGKYGGPNAAYRQKTRKLIPLVY